MTLATPRATSRYNRYVTVEFDSGADAQEFFYRLGEQMGFDPRNGNYPLGTGLDWALRQLSDKHDVELTRHVRKSDPAR
jgi:hypothetical protein